ncbi:hypothetical protein FRZ03_02195 [Streptomyces misionensis]|uniref:Uncharacterized protein n=1 Tax=Streptomyces misionensis TaxID=67331 RepID=A0A5C6K4Z7_9ACTN|nr:hypothetical protein [Streptomyces misionensis]TWV57421.1 hypothetical protein FRZ03_02195 [Streptomyces misionensis]
MADMVAMLHGGLEARVTPWDSDIPLMADGDGEIVCRYGLGAAGPVPPLVSIRIRHRATSGRRLWCVLLDLTDSYTSHTGLFDDGRFVGPGYTGYALDNRPVQLSLPAHRPPRPGAFVRDWLKLIVCEGELNTVPFHLDRWDPLAPLGSRGTALRHADGVLRFDAPARSSRDAQPEESGGPGPCLLRRAVRRQRAPHGSPRLLGNRRAKGCPPSSPSGSGPDSPGASASS